MKSFLHAVAGTGAGARLAAVCLAGLLSGLAAPAAIASDVNLLEQRVQLSFGTFVNASDLEIRVDGSAGETGTRVDWGSTFGDQDKARGRLDGLWRIAGPHYLRFMYTDYSRSKARTIQEDIIWQGEEIPVSATATATFAFEIIEAAYEYAFMQSDTFELTGSLGLHYTSMEASLRAEVDIGGGQGVAERGGTADVDAPLPVIGGRSLWRFHNNFYLDVVAQAFYLTIGEYDGTILNGRAVVLWQPAELIGVGFGYDWFRIDVDLDRSSFSGTIDWTYSGPQVFFNVSF